MMKYIEQVNDTMKFGLATAAPVLTVFGVPVETWGYILSAIVSLMFIIEKTPIVYSRLKQFREWLNECKK